jgi:hypothetical protein
MSGKMIGTLARIGLAAKGVNYLLIGVFAMLAVMSARTQVPGKNGAWLAMAREPGGRVLLGFLAVGLACHGAWRILSGVFDLDRKGRRLLGLCIRFGYVCLGALYLLFAVTVSELAFMRQRPPSDDKPFRTLAATLLEQPLGVWLLAAVAIGFLIAGIANVVQTVKAEFTQHLRLSELSAAGRRVAVQCGRIGTSTIAFICFMTAAFLFFAAYTGDSSEAKGLAGALRTIARQPFGLWLVGLVSVGLITNGAFQFVEMRYRRLPR